MAGRTRWSEQHKLDIVLASLRRRRYQIGEGQSRGKVPLRQFQFKIDKQKRTRLPPSDQDTTRPDAIFE